MLLQCSGFGKVLMTSLALERSVSRMRLEMAQYLLFACEALLAMTVAGRPVTIIVAAPASDVCRCYVCRQRVTGREGAATREPMANMRGGGAVVVILLLTCRRFRCLRRRGLWRRHARGDLTVALARASVHTGRKNARLHRRQTPESCRRLHRKWLHRQAEVVLHEVGGKHAQGRGVELTIAGRCRRPCKWPRKTWHSGERLTVAPKARDRVCIGARAAAVAARRERARRRGGPQMQEVHVADELVHGIEYCATICPEAHEGGAPPDAAHRVQMRGNASLTLRRRHTRRRAKAA